MTSFQSTSETANWTSASAASMSLEHLAN
jgi:hypothetical protein